MNTRTKSVFYCDFCRKHGLSRHAMEKHERVCTMNPERVCRWGENHEIPVAQLAAEIERRANPKLTSEDVAWLHDEVDGCPPCMLAVFRQSGIEDYHYDDRYQRIWDYDLAIKEYRENERVEMDAGGY